MGFIGGLYDILKDQAVVNQANATAADTYALSQQRMANVQMQNINMQKYWNGANALSQVLSGWHDDPTLQPAPGDSDEVVARKTQQRMIQQANLQLQGAQAIMRAGGDPKMAQDLQRDAIQNMWHSAYVARQGQQVASQTAGRVAGIAAGAKDDATGQAAYDMLVNEYPLIAQSQQWGYKPDGSLDYNSPLTQSAFNNITSIGTSAKDRALINKRVLDAKIAESREKSREAVDTATVNAKNAAAARSQAGVKESQTRVGIMTGAITPPAGVGTTGKPLTVPQQTHDAEIDAARSEVAGLSSEEVQKYYDRFSPENMRNPSMLATINKANTHKYGPDPEYQSVRDRLSPVRNLAGKPAAAASQKGEATAADMNKQVAPLTPQQIQTAAKLKGVAPVLNDDDYDKLAKGTQFIGPDGRTRIK
jgi:hypothetical protein